MSGNLLLDGAILSISLFNTIALLWLALTVLLNAQRRTWGVWLIGLGLAAGALFFVSHGVIASRGLEGDLAARDTWWHLGWAPVTVAPLSWYIAMLWYSGFWEEPAVESQTSWRGLRRAHSFGLALAAVGCALVLWLLLRSNPLPDYSDFTQLQLLPALSLAGVPLLVWTYAGYMAACILLALDALRRPGPTRRVMGQQARHRARPWLVATSLTLLSVSLLVTWAMLAIIRHIEVPGRVPEALSLLVARFDLGIAFLLGYAVTLLGQAITSYEVFTGKALPRNLMRRQWYLLLLMGAVFAIALGYAVALRLPAIYTALGGASLAVGLYALLTWRTFVEREALIHRLRPFLSSPRVIERLVHAGAAGSAQHELAEPFRALCVDVLDTHQAYLFAAGPLANFAGGMFVHPPAAPALPAATARELEAQAVHLGSGALYLPLDPQHALGCEWAIPLWSEGDLAGMLVLGARTNGAPFTQEEFEAARAAAERLLDTRATATIAERLMALQRERISEIQVVDQRTRQALHDEVLPELHTAILRLSASSAASPAASEAIHLLGEAHRQLSQVIREIPASSIVEVRRLGLFGALRKAAEMELAAAFAGIEWHIAAEAEARSRELAPVVVEVLFLAAREAMRNAAYHGRGEDPARALILDVTAEEKDGLTLVIADNGVGVEAEMHAAGDGQGLALHSTLMAIVGGTLEVDSSAAGTQVRLHLPR
jgi:signal transduction histidine kinase